VPARAEPPFVPPPPPDRPSAPAFDWEELVGDKLFPAVSSVALVFGAVFFLRYSIDSGWLQPPVRVAIGILVAIGLLVGCELKAARRYPVLANAMDAAAIAILFATFFAAHALWNLIPSLVAFGLLAMVTALAVLLSIRRESLFIAVLGLLGGFATPALLSTGENRPIPLFAYLLLLNVGLAQVAHAKRWPVLTGLTLVLTWIRSPPAHLPRARRPARPPALTARPTVAMPQHGVDYDELTSGPANCFQFLSVYARRGVRSVNSALPNGRGGV
jgi:uncharacterized membrane protein